VMGEKANDAYGYAQNLRRKFEDHSWSRGQTRYDSDFIAYINARLMVMCNKVYQLTQEKKC